MPVRLNTLRPVSETMEPRILHSADLAPLVVADAAGGIALQQAVQQPANDAVGRSSEIVFVDLSVPDAQTLLDDLKAQRDSGRAIEIITIAADQDGLALITDTLAGRSDVSAVHVLAHGSDGQMLLGNARLDGQTLLARADQVASWSRALTGDADLLLYGCDFAQTAVGQQLVRDLALLTGADVAASTDLTGAAQLEGNWTLEYRSGAIEASLAPTAQLQLAWAGTLAIFIADPNVSDGQPHATIAGQGSLRWTINQANALPEDDTIQLLAGTHRITLVGSDNVNLAGDLDIYSNISFVGATTNAEDTVVRSTVSGERVFDLPSNSGVTVSFSNLKITGGVANSSGGGINAGNSNFVTMTNVVVSGNSAANGGGISAGAGATLTLNQVTVSGNSASGAGGGIEAANQTTVVLNMATLTGNNAAAGAGLQSRGATTMTDVVISGNSASGNGGGFSQTTGQASSTLNRVTISGNSAASGGGIYGGGGVLNASNVTISGNSAAASGGGIYVNNPGYSIANATIASNSAPVGTGGGVYTAISSYISVKNTILASNTGGNANMLLTSLGYNADTDGTAVAGGGTNLRPTVAELKLSTLANNGGFTRTHALLAGSLAINAGDPGAPATDQRDTARAGAPDIGAYEFVSGNNAPILDSSKSPTLTSVLEDAAIPVGAVGTLVSDLVDFANVAGGLDNVNDPDAGAVLGIALTGADTSNGSWFYALAGGPWILMGAVSNNAALLLAADAATRLTFRPNANFNGTIANAITFRAWDRSSGANGDTVSTASNGGGSAFSTATDSAALTVLSVNDAPSGTSTSLAVDKNGIRKLAASDFGFTDSAGESNALQSVLIQLPSAGTITRAGTAITAATEVTVAELAAGTVIFVPATGATGMPYATIGFQVRDDGGTANGGIDLDPTQRTLSIQIVNRAPVLTSDGGGASATVFVQENSTAVTTVSGSDPDGDPVSYAITGGADELKFNINATTGELSFKAPPDFEVPGDAGFDNIYNVVVAIRDNNSPQAETTQSIAVRVTDVVEGAGPGQLWFTTSLDQTSIAGGTTWNTGQVLRYGNAGDSFDINAGLTNGTVEFSSEGITGFTARGQINGAGALDARVTVRAMHYVQSPTLIGSSSGGTNTTTQLNSGDLLLTLDPGGSPDTVTLNPGSANAVIVERQDIVVFRPTTQGDYSSGTYYMLLDNGVKSGATTYNVHGLSLVETATDVGVGADRVTLQAGTLVVAHSSRGLHNNVYTVQVNSTAKTAISTNGTNATSTNDRVLLLNGTTLGLPANNNKISGLHLLTAPTTFNGVALAAGTVLVAIDDSFVSGSSYGGVSLDGRDIVALSVTAVGASTAGTATLLFDGSDLSITGTNWVNGFTVVGGGLANRAPVLNAAIVNQSTNEDTAYAFTFAAGTFADADPGDTLTYTATLPGGALLPAWLVFDAGNRHFSGTPANADVGSITVRVTATDSQGASAFSDFVLTVNNVNDAPVLERQQEPRVGRHRRGRAGAGSGQWHPGVGPGRFQRAVGQRQRRRQRRADRYRRG